LKYTTITYTDWIKKLSNQRALTAKEHKKSNEQLRLIKSREYTRRTHGGKKFTLRERINRLEAENIVLKEENRVLKEEIQRYREFNSNHLTTPPQYESDYNRLEIDLPMDELYFWFPLNTFTTF